MRPAQPESFILKSILKLVFFFMSVFAVYLFVKGTNDPGSGFAAGVAFGICSVLVSMTLGSRNTARILQIDPLWIAAFGLVMAYGTAAIPMLYDLPFFYAEEWLFWLPFVGDLAIGSTYFFDLGVFLVVVGVTSKVCFLLADQYDQRRTEESESKLRSIWDKIV